MPNHFSSELRLLAVAVLLSAVSLELRALPLTKDTRYQVRLILNTAEASGSHSIRIAKDPRNNELYYLKFNGDIYRVTVMPGDGTSKSAKAYSSADHGISDSAQGMAIGPDGTIYVVGNFTTSDGNSTLARIMKGVPSASGERAWSLLAKTDAYPRSKTAFDHVFNGIVVSPDGQFVYLNSGSRTDHGEVQSNGGAFPNTREVALTAKIFRLPATATDLTLPNDLNALRNAGYIFAEGTRNSFDLAFAANGDLFAAENGPDRDMPEELNWLRPGQHYGFPWRIGGLDNPQQFANYDPKKDLLLDPRFIAVQGGYYHNDPSFPPAPANLIEPVINVGPDADVFRDPADGSIKDATSVGLTLATFTAHRSPLGLVFDAAGAMAPPFQYHGFVLSWTTGDANGTSVVGPFKDESRDLLDLELTKLGGTNYQARVKRLVTNFANPIDAEIVRNKIYVIEYNGAQGIWEVTFPAAAPPSNASPTVVVTAPNPNAVFAAPASFNIQATATDSDGSVARVEFFNGSDALGTLTASPYSFSVSGLAAGVYTISAVATDNLGAKATNSVAVTVNAPPSIRLISPTDNTRFTPGASITIQAAASDSDGSVTQVQFFANSDLLGAATSSPFSFTWTGAGVGNYSLSAKATDNWGATSVSSAVNISVDATTLPAPVKILNPQIKGNGFVFSFATENGLTYTVQFTDSFSPINWNTLTLVSGNGSVISVTGAIASTQRFYRVKAQ